MVSKLQKSTLAILLIGIIMTFITTNLHWGKYWNGILGADAKGYYAYLPAVFIYQDLNFGFFESIEIHKYYYNLFYDYRAQTPDKKTINKYYCGTAVAELPFFMIGHIMSYINGYERDGYSKMYLLSLTIGGVFYLLLGLLYLDRLLVLYHIEEKIRIWVIISTVFGTHLFYYSVVEMGMSHVYSFAFINIFIYYIKQYFAVFSPKNLLFIGAALGMIWLIRPINGLIVFAIPFIAGEWEVLKKGILFTVSKMSVLIPSLLICLSICSIQSLYYKLAAGRFWVYSYGVEGFYFTDPNIINILFSYRKGLFVYTPLLFVSLWGSYFLWQKARFSFYSILAFLFFITYVFSCWWMWFYGGSFSSRVYVEYLSLFMILFAMLLSKTSIRYLRTSLFTLTVLLIVLCQIQTYQYRYSIIHWSDMTKEKYWNSYLQIPSLLK